MNQRFIQLQKLFRYYDFSFFTSGVYNMNLFAVRAENQKPNRFNDIICVAYYDEVGWFTQAFPATTVPGSHYLFMPPETYGKGIAVLPESTSPGIGQRKFKIGKHRGEYEALRQAHGLKIIRDIDGDGELLDKQKRDLMLHDGKFDFGFFGINIHRGREYAVEKHVDKWSAGCQVLQSGFDWLSFFGMITRSSEIFGDTFTYTLYHESDIKEALGSSINGFRNFLNRRES